MERSRVETALRAIVTKHARIRLESFGDEHALAGDLGFDSLAFLMMLSDLEVNFQVPFPLEQIDQLQDVTFGELVRLVGEQIDRKSGTVGDER